MFQTKNDLPEKIREQSIRLLQSRLADGIDLIQQVKHAHWNVKGPNFIALHKLFDKIHGEIEESVDLLAERIAQLGGLALGTCQEAAKASSLPAYPTRVVAGEEHVEALSTSLAAFAKLIREAIEKSDDLDDATTADIFTEISRQADQSLWFVEAHIPAAESRAGRARGGAVA